MKANLKKIFGLVALSMTLLANTVPTWAGNVNILEVSITTDQTSVYASGSMAGARYSADSNQVIGCTVTFYDDPYTPKPFVTCFATDSTGKETLCSTDNTSDPRFVEAVQAMTDSSYIAFTHEHGSTECTYLNIFDGSNQLQ